MTPYFITATGTGIGKTLFTAALAYQLRALGKRVRAIKPVISGFEEEHVAGSDTGILLAAQAMPQTKASIEAVSPWRFTAPISPDMAAQQENRVIDLSALVRFCMSPEPADYLLVEGVGGVMVPLNAEHTVLDWMAALGFPVILLAGNYLGSISHTLTCARVIAAAGLHLHAVVVSASHCAPVPFTRMRPSLERFLPSSTRLLHIERLDSCPELWKYVPDNIQGSVQ